MIVVSFVLYYMIQRYGRALSKIVCPICFVFFMGYLLQKYGTIAAVHDNEIFVNLGIVRTVQKCQWEFFCTKWFGGCMNVNLYIRMQYYLLQSNTFFY